MAVYGQLEHWFKKYFNNALLKGTFIQVYSRFDITYCMTIRYSLYGIDYTVDYDIDSIPLFMATDLKKRPSSDLLTLNLTFQGQLTLLFVCSEH